MAWNYKTGGKPFKMGETKKEIDPKSKTSFRGKTYIPVGDKVTVEGTYTRKKKTATWT